VGQCDSWDVPTYQDEPWERDRRRAAEWRALEGRAGRFTTALTWTVLHQDEPWERDRRRAAEWRALEGRTGRFTTALTWTVLLALSLVALDWAAAAVGAA
jgi:hypothetical protein